MQSHSSKYQKRIIRDVADVYKSPLHEQGIYYKHSDTEIDKGYAMIIGPEDTPYQYGMYLFEFEFPHSYPFNPPKVIFKTGDGKSRLNPNLYVQGKVCLSILNTWSGEQWSSCQTIRTILMTLVTVLNEYPLKNEPGFNNLKDTHFDIVEYNNFIRYKNIEVAILNVLQNPYTMFIDEIQKHISKHKDKIQSMIKVYKEKYDKHMIHSNVYPNGIISCDYELLEHQFNDLLSVQ